MYPAIKQLKQFKDLALYIIRTLILLIGNWGFLRAQVHDSSSLHVICY